MRESRFLAKESALVHSSGDEWGGFMRFLCRGRGEMALSLVAETQR